MLNFPERMVKMGKVFLGLVHYPVYNKRMETISTSITNLDLHDIARSATTYGVEKYFVIHPDLGQQALAGEIIDYWQTGYGGVYNPDRQVAFACMMRQDSVQSTLDYLHLHYSGAIKTVVTDARSYPNSIGYAQLRHALEEEETHYLLLFGTGWGMTEALMQEMDYRLLPILGRSGYNHLSVRGAVAIVLDRLLGHNSCT